MAKWNFPQNPKFFENEINNDTTQLSQILSRIDRVAQIIERDAVSRGNQLRAKEIMTLVDMAFKELNI